QFDSQREPRAWQQWHRRNRSVFLHREPVPPGDNGLERHHPDLPSVTVQPDWNFSLQTATANAGIAPSMFPAKYSFNPIGAASCANDFVIYGLNVAGSATQANFVGVNNLYTGTTGLCGTITNNGGSGTAATPAVKWAYNVTQSGSTTGKITNSAI